MGQLEKVAREDVLTGLFNRRHFIKCLNDEITRQCCNSNKGVLVLFDIDHFKIVNDTYGHQAGDLILKVIADLTLNTVEAIRQSFETQKTPWDDSLVSVTASFGLTALKCSSDDVLKTFDQILMGVNITLNSLMVRF